MKEPKDVNADEREPLELWQSVDTFADHFPVWKKNQEPYNNPWEVKSFGTSQETITGRPVWPRKKYLGKTPRRWLEVCLFFTIFYTTLLWSTIAFYHFFFYVTVADRTRPVYQDLLLRERGLTILPQALGEYSIPQIELAGKNEFYDKFIQNYSKKTGEDCTFGGRPSPGTYCNFDVNKLGPCKSSESHCIIVRLTRAFDWLPKPYNESDQLPSKFPEQLKSIFDSTPSAERDVVWISCHGLRKKDRDDIKLLSYYPPTASIPAYYFPFLPENKENYQDPLVGVKIFLKSSSAVQIYCKAWAQNIREEDPDDGSVSVEIRFIGQ